MMDDKTRTIVYRWWQSLALSAEQLKTQAIVPAPSAHKAQLKRCESADAAMLTEGFQSLWLALGDDIVASKKGAVIECWATIAAVLVHVKNDNSLTLAQAAGKKTDHDKSAVSALRFAQLQHAKTPLDFLRRLRRIVQQLKGEVSVITLADHIQLWFAEYAEARPCKANKRLCVQWAMEYYRAAAAK